MFIIVFLLVIICEVLIILIIFLNICFEMSFLLEKKEISFNFICMKISNINCLYKISLFYSL